MSKASEKRAKDEFNKAYRSINSKTIELRERFYGSVVAFETQRLEDKVFLLTEKRGNTTDSRKIKDLDQSIRRVEGKLNRKFTNQLQWVAEAKQSFDAKITKVSQRLVEFGLTKGWLTIEDTWIESAQEMSFLINGEIWERGGDKIFLGTAHARLIWVNCTEKASHFRFITTLKDKPGTKNNSTEKKVEVVTPQKGLSRGAQVALQAVQGKTANQIAKELDMNVSYVRTLLRKARN